MTFRKNTTCFLCGGADFALLHKGVRGSKDIHVVRCIGCGLVQLDKFITDLDAFYEESNMRPVQKSIREIRTAAYNDDYRRFLFTRNMIENKTVLDFGAGGGGYVCIAKNTAGFICAVELEKAMQKDIRSDGIPCFSSLDELRARIPERHFDVITMFHVLEHLQNPVQILQSLADLLSDGGKIVIEVPNADDALLSLYKCGAFADFSYWMCHLYLYTNRTLAALVKKAGLRVQFMQQIQRYPLANHLYWLSQGNPGGHQKWASLCDTVLDKDYGDKLAALGVADTIMAVIEKI